MTSVVYSPLRPHPAPSVIYHPVSPSSYHSSRSSLQWTIPLCSPTPALLRYSYHQRFLTRAINLPAENPSDPSRSLDRIIASAQKLLDVLPQQVKNFPWTRALDSFFRLVFELCFTAAKYLSVPVLALSSLSEMSYCGHERKLLLVPFLFLVGFVLAGVLSDTATEPSLGLKEGEFPWHLFLVAAFFLMLKLPGPYYPYWARLFVPHFANGGLWRTVWLVFIWYRGVVRTSMQPDHDGSS